MSDLQLALIALGAVIVVGVILFNWWQERRLMQESMTRFDAPEDDPLMEKFRIDPLPAVRDEAEEDERFVIEEEERFVIEEATVPPYDAPEPEPDFVDTIPNPAFTQAAPEEIPVTTTPSEAQAPEMPHEEANVDQPEPAKPAQYIPLLGLPEGADEHVDLIAVLEFSTPQSAISLYQAIQLMPEFEKPARYSAQDQTGHWIALTSVADAVGCTHMAVALQLADRAGPASQTLLHNFQESVTELARNLDAGMIWRGAEDPLPYSLALDEFCVAVDVMVGFHIIQGEGGSFAGTKLRGIAESHGLSLQDDGAFHFTGPAGDTLFTLVSQDQRPFKPETLRTVFYRGISFQLDVPRVADCLDAFNQMVSLARQIEVLLDGHLVDDNHRPLSNADIEKIRQQLNAIQIQMAERGVIPGSVTALRLFS